ncbi:phosphate ABC transporter substrate-binding protein [Chryseobacterium sp. 6424]|uniref:PstS family phosphate ABC transporter substrate-binding protein n=1 Tax=Chryseobacterium sp. 6424 TaxID=2039166 RepID=UPI000EFC3196|nr:substrate-binding domain-containing protein [Chryseobacterium sp. 6424]AYO56952.1 phosphate ABC transporter substrate-binding protein [Chryseobacterium sp. 6424]
MKFKSVLIIFSLFALLLSCKKSDRVVDDPQQGEITIAADESFQSVAEALTSRYMALNPQTRINLVIKKEDLAFLDLLENKVRVIVMSRELSDSEKAAYKSKIDMDLLPAKFAADAVVFVVSKDTPRESISMEELKSELSSEDKNVIFDGTNSSNLNFVAQKFGVKPADLKFSIISGNKNIISEINKQPGKIGVVSLNTLSRPYDKNSEELRNSVKILSVNDGKSSYLPEISSIRNMKYPFTRVLYFITNEGYYGLGNGLIRFSCQQLGQIVVQKEGLQPYNIFPREVQMK